MPRTAIPCELELVGVGRCEGEVLSGVTSQEEGSAWTISAHGQHDVIEAHQHRPTEEFGCACTSESPAGGDVLGMDSGDAVEEPAHSMTRPTRREPEAEVVLDPTGLNVRLDGAVVSLTRTQFSILAYLIQNEGRWVTAGELIRQVLGTHHQPDTSLVRVHVHAIRRRLGTRSAWLESDRRRARGYRWRQAAANREEGEEPARANNG